MRWITLLVVPSLIGCSVPDEQKPQDFRFEGHVWSVSLHEGKWGNTPEHPEPNVLYGTFAGLILSVQSRDNLPLTKADQAEAKAVAAAYCQRRGGKFDQTYSGSFAAFSKTWDFNGACTI